MKKKERVIDRLIKYQQDYEKYMQLIREQLHIHNSKKKEG
jgi:hypothetical protein